ncbi:DNA polymerase III subunit delta' [Corynebacterium epidermidicanis]|uniref:DNA polymerase III subunit delta' n=1 Tax=Corynebacterium epidermidicanis TaxID=1050174 RepID=A0A0G3GM30_9CORY|nr:DNA polymerase III subunit delta' [Corynebacterium epidermidicanis]AKK02184.1 DNA polymerase III, delta subunit [Corynebacterium epidermidicanis]
MSENSVFARLAGGAALSSSLIDAALAARQIAAGTVPDSSAMTHAWLFTGPPGSGRSNTAVAFAAALMCTGEIPGCGECPNCRDVLAGKHPDLVHIVPKELSISVDLMRERVVATYLDFPSIADWRVIIIEDADRLSEGAANALLKTVEEPSPRTVIMLCAPSLDPHDISVTLRSRCRHVYVPTPSIAETTRILLADGGISEETAQLAAAATWGHIGRARHLALSEEAQSRRAQVLHLAELVYHREAAFQEVGSLVTRVEKETLAELAPLEDEEVEKVRNSFGAGVRGKGTAKMTKGMESELKELESKHKKRRTRSQRDAFDLALVDLAGLYRDALLLNAGADTSLTHPDFSGLARDLADRNSAAALTSCLDAIMQCRQSLGYNVRPVVALSGLVGRLRKACRVS